VRNSKFIKLGFVALAAACVAAANADNSGMTGISGRVGIFWPSAGSARDLGTTWFAFGADYKLNTIPVSIPGSGLQSYLSLSGDYYAHGGNRDMPFALNFNVRQNQFVFSAGIGPDFRNSGDLTSTGVGIGEQIGVTYELGNMPTPMFIQAKYFMASKPELSGLAAYVGIRF